MWTFEVGRLFGINIRVHVLFIVFVLLITLPYLMSSLLVGMYMLIFLLLIFGCVLLHELGHCLMAQHHGIRVRDIMIWPLGGVANMEYIPDNPYIEMKIAIAGPLVNLAIAFILCPLAVVAEFSWNMPFFTQLIYVNLLLMFFNLIPALPMDGGRIFRAWQSTKVGFLEATRKAVKLGSILAIAMGIFGLLIQNFMLIFIAVFVYMAGREELALIEAQRFHGDWEGNRIIYPNNRSFFVYNNPKQPHQKIYPSQQQLEVIMRDLRDMVTRNFRR